MSIVKEILDGWGNLIKAKIGKVDPAITEMGMERMKICHECPIRNYNSCDPRKSGIHAQTGQLFYGCGCKLSAKTLSPCSECPGGKWHKNEELCTDSQRGV